MKKKYTVLFTTLEGTRYEYEFITENITKAIQDYCSSKQIKEHKIIDENTNSPKKMLFG